MNTDFHYPQGHLTLHRWPLQQPNNSLQAWDAADELLLQHAFEAIQHFQQTEQRDPLLLIINDSFGALCCALSAYPQEQWNDSWLAQQATRYNLQQNNLSAAKITQRSSVEPLETKPDIVLLKLPANHSYLTDILQQLATVVSANTVILAAAKAKDITRNILGIFSQTLGEATASLTVKKCRLIRCHATPDSQKKNTEFPLKWALENSDFTIVNHSNVFSREKLDEGARVLLQHLPNIEPGNTVIDLGCGNGVLGLQLLAQYPETKMVFCDESFMAVESARETIQLNLPHLMEQCRFIADDSLSSQPDDSADIIICNPPFHQQHAVTTHIASQMFKDARRVLKKGGRLRIVANRHLPYAEQLQRLFGHCRQLTATPKFIILDAIKRG